MSDNKHFHLIDNVLQYCLQSGAGQDFFSASFNNINNLAEQNGNDGYV